MNGLELAAIITAIGAAAGSIFGLFLNGKRIAELRGQIKTLKDDNSHLRRQFKRRMFVMRKIILDRESQINHLQIQQVQAEEREKKWREWGDRMGREYNQMQLLVGALQQQIADLTPNAPKPALKTTLPLKDQGLE